MTVVLATKPVTDALDTRLSAAEGNVATLQSDVAAVVAGQVEGMLGYATLADLLLVTDKPLGTLARVYGDPVVANNGVYSSDGAGGWEVEVDRVSEVATTVSDLETLTSGAMEQSIATLGTVDSVTNPGMTVDNVGTITGYGGPVGPKQNFTRVYFWLRQWDATHPITAVRVLVRETNHTGTIIADKTVTGVSLTTGVDTLYYVDLDARVVNAGASNLWIAYFTDGRTGVARVSGDAAYPESSGYPRARFSQSGSTTTLTTSAYSDEQTIFFRLENRDIDNPVTVPTQDFADAVGQAAGVNSISARVDDAELLLAAMAAATGYVTSSVANIPVEAVSPALNTSTFSGHGSPIGPKQNFNRIRITGKAFDNTAIPTQLRLKVFEVDVTGTELADVTIDIAPEYNVQTEIAVLLPSTIANAGAVNLYVMYWTNGRWGTLAGLQSVYYPTPTYAKGRYSTSGSITTLSTAQVSGDTAVNYFLVDLVDTTRETATPSATFANDVVQAVTENYHGGKLDSFGRWYMRDFRAQAAKIRSSTVTQAVVAVIGDSWVGAFAFPLSQILIAEYGNAGAGYCGIGASHGAADTAKVTLARTGTWTDSDAQATSLGPDIAHANSTVVGSKATIAALDKVTTFVLHYIKQANGGTLRYRVDGGSWTSVNTDNATTAHATVSISGLSDAAHTLEVEVEIAGSAGVTLLGVDVQRAAAGARVHAIGNSGSRADQWTAVDATIWEASLTALAPNAVGVVLGTNDHSANVPKGAFKARIKTLVDRIRAALPRADVFLIAPADNDLTGKSHTIYEYSAMMAEAAVEHSNLNDHGVAYYDLARLFGDYANANTRGMYLNGTHLNATGQRLAAGLVFNELLYVR